MTLIKIRIIRLTFLIIFIAPLAAWYLIKPIRLIAPEVLDIKCYADGLCLDNEEKYAEARILHLEAIAFLSKNTGSFESTPNVVFCSTWECATKLGLGKRSAVTFATYGSAISPRAWKPHYVRHELIHQLQAQELGLVKLLMLPSWLVEGMAYSLSQDPRTPLTQPWEGYRTQFVAWRTGIGESDMWSEAAKE